MKRFFSGLVLFSIVLAIIMLAASQPAIGGALAIALPYAALAIFLIGVVYRVAFKWGKAPVPFRIPTTCGQHKSLPWIKPSGLENPSSLSGVLGRMFLEVFLFRSLFRNTKLQVRPGPVVSYEGGWELWAAAMAFHWAFLVILLRHLRYFLEPVPMVVALLPKLDGFFEIGIPTLFVTNIFIVVGLGFLLLRRLASPQLRYISLAADYFPLLLLLGVVTTGIILRHFGHTDVAAIKEFGLGLVTFHPVVPASAGWLFLVHISLVSVLFAYFPFSKLMHMPGVFMSPTRNLANNNREVRHINPWNAPVKVHTYEEWEEEFHDKIVACGLPLDKG